jgi:DNA-binding response OmpR family regulator
VTISGAQTKASVTGDRTAALAVLVAEDDVHVQGLIKLCLEGQKVTLASTCAIACDELNRHSYDVVITDLKLAGCDGLEVARLAARTQPKAYIVIMTGSTGAGPHCAEDLRSTGAHARLQKPFLPRELRAVVETARRRGREQ